MIARARLRCARPPLAPRGAAVVMAMAAAMAAIAAGSAGCRRGAAESGAQLSAKWSRADSAGTLATAATAKWCATGRYLDIRAAHGDTGLAVAIFPKDTAAATWAGRYVLRDTVTDSIRPVAAVALRWADLSAVSAFRSDSGTVVLRRAADGRLTGELAATGRLLGGMRRRLNVTGSFRDVAVLPAPAACPDLMQHPKDSSVNFFNADSLLQRLKRRPDLLPQRLRPQGSSGRPPQRGLPQPGGRRLPGQ